MNLRYGTNNNYIRNSIIGLYPVLLFILLFSPGNLFSQAVSAKPDYSLTIDSITIACEPDYPPFCFVDKDGNPDGFAIDLFEAAAKAIGREVNIKVGIWHMIKEDLAEGKIDALPLVGRNSEREEIFDFSISYISLHGAIFVRKGTSDIESLDDLKGKQLFVMKGDNAEEFVHRNKISNHIISTNTFEEAFRKLANGEGDAILTQRIIGLKLIEQLRLRKIEPLEVHIPEFRQDFCFAVKKGNQALLSHLNEGLSIIIANDQYEEIRSTWFGPLEQENLSFRDILKIALIVFIPLLIVVAGFLIFFLRREVARQTEELNDEIAEHKNTLHRLSEQKSLYEQSEGQLSLLLNSTAEGIYGIDKDGNCTFVNVSALNQLRYNDSKQVIGKKIHNLIHHTCFDGSKHSDEECGIILANKERKESHSDNEFFWRSDGSGFSVEYFSHPIIFEGKFLGTVVTFWDITERKKSEEELLSLKSSLEVQVKQRTQELEDKVYKLNRSQTAMLYMVEDLNRTTNELKEERHKLEQSNKELDAFCYSVSHDLRAPLRAIDGFSRFLEEDYFEKLDDEGKRLISVICKNTEKMDELISDLLDFSRISRGQLHFAEVDMQASASSLFSEIASDAEKKSFELNIMDLPPAKCDVRLINQVWQNLIGNALKYSSRSDIKRIEIGAQQEENQTIYYVKDFGAGFESKYVNKIFGVFQRLHTDEDFEGTGIGLAIVERIISLHGGKVWAVGEVNKGATFKFSLPIHS